jgi:type II secretory pathway component PulF
MTLSGSTDDRHKVSQTTVETTGIRLNEDLSDYLQTPRRAEGHLTPFRLVAHCYVWGLFLLLLAFLVPRIEAIFADFGVPLPKLTRLVLRASHLVSSESPPVVAITSLLLILLGADWLMLDAQSKRGDEGWAMAWSMLMLASPLLLIALTLVALFLPVLTTMTRLSG